ncbi:MAG: type III secretion system export apparatus subunit SctU [Simkaniaceae bacterium]|nr:type III secretion system export apparatus subunit SctU [Simkaniaceae bacterium]
MAEKTEKATPKKLRDARKKGQVAKSQDFPAAFTFIVSISTVLIMGNAYYEAFASYLMSMFRMIRPGFDLTQSAGAFIRMAIDQIFRLSLPIMVGVSLVGVLINFLIVGPVFSIEAMKFDIKKLNPIEGIKNKFKLKTFVELLKSIAKIGGALFIIYNVVKTALPEVIATAALPPIGCMYVFSSFLVKVVIHVGIFFIAVALFDLIFQKRQFAKSMMMEKYDIKKEMKDSEGDPHIKGKRKQIAQEMAYQEGPRATKRARTVITNPTHIAVALEYNAQEMPAPKILTMGKGTVAEQIIKIAGENDVPIMRNVPLAHQLFEEGSIGGYIPEDTYSAMAEIMKWLGELESTEQKPEYHPELFT